MKTVGTLILAFITMSIFAQTNLEPGDKVADFNAVTDDNSTWKLKNNLDRKYLVIYFYPAAMTGGCTKQACAYRDMGSALESYDARVVGISGDKPESLKFFKQAHNLNFTLLSDESGSIAKLFGVPLRAGGSNKGEFNGRNYEFEREVTTGRWTFILDKNGKVVYKNDQVNASEDTQDVIEFLKSHS